MAWLEDNMGYVAFFAIVLLILLAVLGVMSGKFPAITDAMRSVVGA